MFTIKHIHCNGEEFLWEAEFPRFIPRAAKADSPVKLPGLPNCPHIEISTPNAKGGDRQELYGGTVFVMNSAGQTVARYDLGNPPGVSGAGECSAPIGA